MCDSSSEDAAESALMRILIVWPDTAPGRMIAKLLGEYGSCDWVTDTKAALQFFAAALSDQPYGLVAIDCRLPGMDGFAALGMLREQETAAESLLQRSTVCLLSADDEQVLRYELRYGPDQGTYCLTDPLNLDALEVIAKIARTRCRR